jgi:hypothetical protein
MAFVWLNLAMTSFTPGSALAGGLLIGLAAAALWLFHGRIAGISGIFGGVLAPPQRVESFRWAFLAGLVAAGAVAALLAPSAIGETGRSVGAIALAGALVGFGTRVGSGCTSGHGVCGIARLSLRSVVATCVFIATGAATVALIRVAFGGSI